MAAGIRFRLLFSSFLLFTLCGESRTAEKTDTLVTLQNGTLIGEVKELDRGKLVFDTDAADKISVKWDHVIDLRSPRYFRVELSDGRLFFGSLDTDTTTGSLIIILQQFRHEAPLNQVVAISRIKATFWDRLDLSVSAGLNFQKGSGVGNVNSTLNASYRRDYDLRIFKADFVTTVQKGKNPTRRYDVSFQSNWSLGNQWFTNVYAAYQKNTELGVVSRYIAGGGGGRYLVHQTNQYFYLAGGLYGTFETGRDSTEMTTTSNSVEGLVATRYALFRFNEPEIDLETYLNLFPTLPDFDRVRIEFDIVLKWEIVKDLFWNLSFYQSYDSRPPSQTASKTDYGINLALGWKL